MTSRRCRVSFLRRATVLAVAVLLSRSASAICPNIVVIVADDQGYHELGCYGNTDVPTPHIDSLAANGIRFTAGYVSAPVCSPTRAGLLTGRYQQRFGHEFNVGKVIPPTEFFGLPIDQVTLADRLRAAGYATGIFGKWHLGDKDRRQHPLHRGFDEFFGFLGGGHSFLQSESEPGSVNPILDGFQPVEEIGYTTDEFAIQAASFIERHKDRPFFVYLPFNAVHLPLEATRKYLDRFSTIQDDNRRTFAAMLSAMDDGVGLVLAKLRTLGLEDSTLIVYLSDNGGPTAKTTSSNAPWRGFKRDVLEGGVRVPFIIQWKEQLPAGLVDARPVISLDIHATALAAAGLEVSVDGPALDGVNLLPFLRGEREDQPHKALFWRYGRQWAIRQGDWKLCRDQEGTRCLFHLPSDPGEAQNLVMQEEEKARELQLAYDSWNAELIPGRWEDRHAQEGK